MLRNLLEETLERMKLRGKLPHDVRWVGLAQGEFSPVGSWDDFAKLAAVVDYDSGFGGQVVARDLVVVGDGWWLERGEYDGSEWWSFKSLPVLPGATNALTLTDVKEEW